MAREFEHIRRILIDTVTILCKNSIHFDRKLNVQGLIGITLDEGDVLLVHINEEYKCNRKFARASDDLSTDSEAERNTSGRLNPSAKLPTNSFKTDFLTRRKRKRPGKNNNTTTKCSDSAEENNYSDTEICIQNKNTGTNFREFDQTAEVNSTPRILDAQIKSEHITDGVAEDNASLTVEDFFLSTDVSTCKYLDPVLNDDAKFTSQLSYKFCEESNKANTARDLSVKTTGSLRENYSTRESMHKSALGSAHRSAPYEMIYGEGEAALQSSSLDMLYGSTRERRSAAASAEKTFLCDYESCSKAYYDKKNLLRHQTRHHGRVPAFQRNMRYNAGYESFNNDFMTID